MAWYDQNTGLHFVARSEQRMVIGGRLERLWLGGLGLATLAAILVSGALYALTINRSAAVTDTSCAVTILVDQNGRKTSLDEMRGRFVLLNFVYTGCGRVCPVQTEQLASLQHRLPSALQDHIRFLSISVDPANDSPATLKRFATLHGADLSNWSFVTGEPKALSMLALAYASRPPGGASSDHAADIRLLDPDGRLLQRYSGTPVAVGRIAAEILQLAQLPTAGSR